MMVTLGKKIKAIQSIHPKRFSVELKFTDGFVGTVSLKDIFESPKGLAAEVLKGNLFSSCFVESGALAWPNGLEFCPDAIRMWIQKQANKKAA